MAEQTETLLFISGPGHGWLRVPLAAIADLSLEGEISACSFRDGRYAYLEEDCDAPRYLAARAAQGGPTPDIEVREVAHFDRSRPRFGDREGGER